jgi:hypothetical protein
MSNTIMEVASFGLLAWFAIMVIMFQKTAMSD